jgi:hypothetical protein
MFFAAVLLTGDFFLPFHFGFMSAQAVLISPAIPTPMISGSALPEL